MIPVAGFCKFCPSWLYVRFCTSLKMAFSALCSFCTLSIISVDSGVLFRALVCKHTLYHSNHATPRFSFSRDEYLVMRSFVPPCAWHWFHRLLVLASPPVIINTNPWWFHLFSDCLLKQGLRLMKPLASIDKIRHADSSRDVILSV